MVREHQFSPNARAVYVIISRAGTAREMIPEWGDVVQICIHDPSEHYYAESGMPGITRLHLTTAGKESPLEQLAVMLFILAQYPDYFTDRDGFTISPRIFHTDEQFFALCMYRILDQYFHGQPAEDDGDLVDEIRSRMENVSYRFPVPGGISQRPVSGSVWNSFRKKFPVPYSVATALHLGTGVQYVVRDVLSHLYGQIDWERGLEDFCDGRTELYESMASEIWDGLAHSEVLNGPKDTREAIKIAINSLAAECQQGDKDALFQLRNELSQSRKMESTSVDNLADFFEAADSYHRQACLWRQKEFLLQSLQGCISRDWNFWEQRQRKVNELRTVYTQAKSVVEPGLMADRSVAPPEIRISWRDSVDTIAAKCWRVGEEWNQDRIFNLVYELAVPPSSFVREIALLLDPGIQASDLTHKASAAPIRTEAVHNLGKTKFIALVFSTAVNR